MDRGILVGWDFGICVPHRRGDEPHRKEKGISKSGVPHRRGDEPFHWLTSMSGIVFPKRGMNRGINGIGGKRLMFSPRRGDEPL